MKRIFCFALIGIFLFTGCENKEEKVKNEYIEVKNNLLSATNYETELPLDIAISIERLDEETIEYKVTLKTPKENMYQVKAMVVHNYNNEDVFPSVGLFSNPKNLLMGDSKANTIELQDQIQTTKNISNLDLKLKIWIEYQNEQGEVKDIYYRT